MGLGYAMQLRCLMYSVIDGYMYCVGLGCWVGCSVVGYFVWLVDLVFLLRVVLLGDGVFWFVLRLVCL